MKKNPIVLFAGLILLFLSGCSEGPANYSGDFCEIEARHPPFTVDTNAVPFSKLSSDAVLVAVNGYPLTKATFEKLMVCKAKEFSSRKDSNPVSSSDQLENFKKGYLRTFVNQRILIDESRRLKAVSREEVEKKVNAMLGRMAASRKLPVKKLMKSFPLEEKYVLYDLAAQIYIDQVITKHIPPKVEVNGDFLDVVKKELKRQNADAVKTNEVIRAELVNLKADILAGKVSFEKFAEWGEGMKEAFTNVGNQVVWSECERGQVDDKRVQAAVFALRVGAVSDPVEDDDGYHLLKVYKVVPPEKNEQGRVIQDEVRRFGHIYRAKVPMMIEDTDTVLEHELKQQMQIQAINEFIASVSTNGTTRIEYPYGRDILR